MQAGDLPGGVMRLLFASQLGQFTPLLELEDEDELVVCIVVQKAVPSISSKVISLKQP